MFQHAMRENVTNTLEISAMPLSNGLDVDGPRAESDV